MKTAAVVEFCVGYGPVRFLCFVFPCVRATERFSSCSNCNCTLVTYKSSKLNYGIRHRGKEAFSSFSLSLSLRTEDCTSRFFFPPPNEFLRYLEKTPTVLSYHMRRGRFTRGAIRHYRAVRQFQPSKTIFSCNQKLEQCCVFITANNGASSLTAFQKLLGGSLWQLR